MLSLRTVRAEQRVSRLAVGAEQSLERHAFLARRVALGGPQSLPRARGRWREAPDEVPTKRIHASFVLLQAGQGTVSCPIHGSFAPLCAEGG